MVNADHKYDIVMSESVFQYFDTLDYAGRVLRSMIEKSEKLTYLGEIHDVEYRDALLEERRRTIMDYDRKYQGLDKLFFSRGWIDRIAAEYRKRTVYTNVDNPYYLNGKYLFNCYIL